MVELSEWRILGLLRACINVFVIRGGWDLDGLVGARCIESICYLGRHEPGHKYKNEMSNIITSQEAKQNMQQPTKLPTSVYPPMRLPILQQRRPLPPLIIVRSSPI